MFKTPEPLLTNDFDSFSICWNFFYFFLNNPRINTDIQ